MGAKNQGRKGKGGAWARNSLGKSKAGKELAAMPELRHKVGSDYQMEISEVYDYFRNSESIMNWLLTKARDADLIQYDKETGKWSGVDYEK